MGTTSAPTHETGTSAVLAIHENRSTGWTRDRPKSPEPERPVLPDLDSVVEPRIEASVDIIERVASVLRMGSIRTW